MPEYIAIEGPIGAGKTALAQLLAGQLKARLVEEPGADNPFLEKFYFDVQAYAFQTQLYFLLARYRQQIEIAQPDLFQSDIVSDYFFEKDQIFAALNLSEHELALYERVYQHLVREVRKPDLVIYLQARTDVLLARIRQRNRPFESAIDPEYLNALNNAYNRFFLHYEGVPLLIVNTEQTDFASGREALADLMREIHSTRSGRRFYAPRGQPR